MKNRKKIQSLVVFVLVMGMISFTGCWGGDDEDYDSSSSYEDSSTSGSQSLEDTMPIMPSSSSLPQSEDYPVSPSFPASESIGDPSSAIDALGNDFAEIGALDKESKDWGPGGPVDDKNRSEGALGYNEKYKDYNTLFLGPDENTVYLTFDEGYEYGLSGEVLDTLKEKKVKAMFFVTYDFAKQAPEIVQRMIDEGHVIGNHSYSHDNYSTLSPKEMADDMMKMHDYIKLTFDYEMSYFRFPAGNFNEQSLALVQKMGYKSLFWSFAYKDWIVDEQPDPTASTKKIVDAACPGNIYLLHAVSATNNQILGDVIDGIAAKGFTWGDPETL